MCQNGETHDPSGESQNNGDFVLDHVVNFEHFGPGLFHEESGLVPGLQKIIYHMDYTHSIFDERERSVNDVPSMANGRQP